MSHMVIFESQDGSTGQQHCDDLDGAVGFVEALRNEQGIDRARIFRMEEVSFQVTPYYVVSLADTNGAAAEGAPAVIPPPPATETDANPFGAVEEPPADPFMAADDAAAEPLATEVPSDPFPTPEGDPFAVPAEVEPVEAAFGDVFEAEAQAVADADIPPIPAVEEVAAEESGRRGLFGR